jgi:hypothetical protein
MRHDLDLTADLSRLVDNAHRGFFDRDIQTHIVLHGVLLPLRPFSTALVYHQPEAQHLTWE